MKAIKVAILAMVLLLSVLGPLASAQEALENDDGNGDVGQGDEQEEEDEFESASREVEVETDDDAFEMRSFGEDGDRIRLRFEAPDAELRLDFVILDTNLTEVQLEIAFEAVMEFVDANGNGAYDLGETVVQQFRVDDMSFEVLTPEYLVDGNKIAVEYTSEFTFRLTFWIFGNETLLNGTLVKPTHVKFDIGIEGFPFEMENSSLAVQMELKTEVDPTMDANASTSLEELQAIAERYAGFFRWSTMAEVDGVLRPVNSTVVKVESEVDSQATEELEVKRIIVLAYPQGEIILHDPVVGITLARLPGAIVSLLSTFAYGLMLGVSALFVVGTLLARRRRTT